MRALVTGAFGFAGRHLVSHLVECGDDVLATYLESEPGLAFGDSARLDVCDPESCRTLFAGFMPEAIYHIAGMAFAPDAERNFGQALRLNVGGTFNVLRAAEELAEPAAVVVVSSSEVYGRISGSELPLTESVPVRPFHNYSLSKAMTELVAQRFAGSQRVRPVVVRAFNHIGPGQRPEFVVSNFAFQLAQIARGKSVPVLNVGNLEAQRDFTDVRDIVRGYRLAAIKGSGTYNLCSGRAVAIREILDLLIDISGVKVEVRQDAARMRASEVPVLYGSFDLARRELGWEPKMMDLRQSLADTYNYWLERV